MREEANASGSVFDGGLFYPDGTIIPFVSKPELNGNQYWSRKKCYGTSVLVVCDDYGRVLFLEVGYPGSAHDQRVYANCALSLQPHKYFSEGEYCIGDSAYTPTCTMVPAFKCATGQLLPAETERVNTALARRRIKAEHTIGMAKGKFQSLKNLRCRIQSAEDLRRVGDWVAVCFMLHNMWLVTSGETWFEKYKEPHDDPNFRYQGGLGPRPCGADNGEFRAVVAARVLAKLDHFE
jgi:hypothetical protein